MVNHNCLYDKIVFTPYNEIVVFYTKYILI